MKLTKVVSGGAVTLAALALLATPAFACHVTTTCQTATAHDDRAHDFVAVKYHDGHTDWLETFTADTSYSETGPHGFVTDVWFHGGTEYRAVPAPQECVAPTTTTTAAPTTTTEVPTSSTSTTSTTYVTTTSTVPVTVTTVPVTSTTVRKLRNTCKIPEGCPRPTTTTVIKLVPPITAVPTTTTTVAPPNGLAYTGGGTQLLFLVAVAFVTLGVSLARRRKAIR